MTAHVIHDSPEPGDGKPPIIDAIDMQQLQRTEPGARITRSQVIEACKVLGFDAYDLVSVTMRYNAVSVTSIVRDNNGARVIAGHDYAKTTTTFPIDNEEPA